VTAGTRTGSVERWRPGFFLFLVVVVVVTVKVLVEMVVSVMLPSPEVVVDMSDDCLAIHSRLELANFGGKIFSGVASSAEQERERLRKCKSLCSRFEGIERCPEVLTAVFSAQRQEETH
jgi:hypothetical protein